MNRRIWIRSAVLLLAVLGIGAALAGWKQASLEESEAAWANQPEPVEVVRAAVAREHDYRPSTTAIGTVLALRSITLRNEVPGTVDKVMLNPGEIVEPGTVLVALDVSVEQAELEALQAQVRLAETVLERTRHLHENRAASQEELDRARAERDVALAQVSRIKAIIDRKTIKAPFRARVGIADVHPGQYLNQGTQLTTLQGVADAVHVDFAVDQQVAEQLAEGEGVEVITREGAKPHAATIVAIDARIDRETRNAIIRAKLQDNGKVPAPGASVQVRVPVGPVQAAVTVPVNALRKGPSGEHVFIIEPDQEGNLRAHVRQVESGAMLGDAVLIREGVTAGERVAASGSFKLRESVLVAVDGNAVQTAMNTHSGN